MRKGLSSLDITALVEELKPLVEGRIDKIILRKEELNVRLYCRNLGQVEIIIIPGKTIHISDYRRPAPLKPPPFAMQLRKLLGNKYIRDIGQHKFERIVEIIFDEYTLIIELFSKGNVIIIDNDRKIRGILSRQVWKDRTLIHGQEYCYPPSFSKNPFKLSKDEFITEFTSSEKDIVRTLAITFGLGGMYAEELCLRAEIDKSGPVNEITAETLFPKLEKLYNDILHNRKPYTISDKTMSFYPIELIQTQNEEKTYYESFNKAIDAYYAQFESDHAITTQESAINKKLKKIKKIATIQEDQIKKFQLEEKKYSDMAETIMNNYIEIEAIIATIQNVRKKMNWHQIKETLKKGKKEGNKDAQHIVDIDENNGKIILEF